MFEFAYRMSYIFIPVFTYFSVVVFQVCIFRCVSMWVYEHVYRVRFIVVNKCIYEVFVSMVFGTHYLCLFPKGISILNWFFSRFYSSHFSVVGFYLFLFILFFAFFSSTKLVAVVVCLAPVTFGLAKQITEIQTLFSAFFYVLELYTHTFFSVAYGLLISPNWNF